MLAQASHPTYAARPSASIFSRRPSGSRFPHGVSRSRLGLGLHGRPLLCRAPQSWLPLAFGRGLWSAGPLPGPERPPKRRLQAGLPAPQLLEIQINNAVLGGLHLHPDMQVLPRRIVEPRAVGQLGEAAHFPVLAIAELQI